MSEWTDQAKTIYAVTLFVDDLETAKKFYGDVFSLAVYYEDAESAVFKFGPTLVNLLRSSAATSLVEPALVGQRDAGPRALFTVQVESVDRVCSELASMGVDLLNGPIDRPWGVRTASFVDPGGHLWEIAQALG